MKKVIDIPDSVYDYMKLYCDSHCYDIKGFIIVSICYTLDRLLEMEKEDNSIHVESVFKRSFETSRSIT